MPTSRERVLTSLAWREPDRLAQLCELVAVSRPGYDLHQLQQALPPDLLSRMPLLEVPGVHVSSTELRRRAAAGLSLHYLTPRPVVRYIAAHGLYLHSPAGPSASGN